MNHKKCSCGKPADRGKSCFACEKRNYRERHEMKDCYQHLKDNSKRRGKVFDLTFDEFERFAVKTNYLAGKGIRSNSYHIDRIDENGPYSIDNIQILTNIQNIRKFVRFKHRDEEGRISFEVVTVKPRNYPDSPF
jgi:hypothetical protein